MRRLGQSLPRVWWPPPIQLSQIPTQNGVSPQSLSQLVDRCGMSILDLFASKSNAKIPSFFSTYLRPQAEGMNAFQQTWLEGISSNKSCASIPLHSIPLHSIPRWRKWELKSFMLLLFVTGAHSSRIFGPRWTLVFSSFSWLSAIWAASAGSWGNSHCRISLSLEGP